ncbi:MAG: hypothetical protein IJB59_14570 [Oscillospiraceae bacterium]|nr:hypothetical protein [Oscillospiraceae bacterium]
MKKKEEGKERELNYSAISWRNFPTDKTMKTFRTEYQQMTNREKVPSDAWLRGAVNALEEEGEKVIFNDLFSPRDHDISLQHSTIPRLIPYEIQDILFAIATVRDQDKNIKGDEFAERVFSILSDNVGQNAVADNYVDILTLNQYRTQQELLRKFEGLLRQRFELLYEYIFGNSHGVQIDALKYALEQIDYLLTRIADTFTENKNTSATQDLQELYTSLLALRKEVVVEKATKNGIVENLNWRDKSDLLIKTLNDQLLQTSRSPKPTEISDFLTNYQKYLLRYLGSDIRENASAFLGTYRELCDYYLSDMNEEQFEEVVYGELASFSNAIFDELDRMELVNSASEYQPKSAATGYLRLRLTQVQENIINKLREPMRMLRAVYTLSFFSGSNISSNKYGKDKISGASNHMRDVALLLLEECQNELSPIEGKMTWYEKLLFAYEHSFSPVYERTIDVRMLEQLIYVLETSPNWSTNYLFAVADLLRRMCKVYVHCECERVTKALLKEFGRLQNLLKK